ncbi:MAG: ABC transporter substrate-binding protein [bacterium]|nr:ABC transporter substrate-binding protein [bacterium]
MIRLVIRTANRGQSYGTSILGSSSSLRHHCDHRYSLPLFRGGDGGTDPALSAQPIRIAFNTWIGYSAFYIAEERGLFDKYGIAVETSVIDPLQDKNAAIQRGTLDGMGGTIDSAIISSAVGIDGKVVMMFDRSNGTDGILVTEDIKTVNDLKGKRVAVEEGFVGHFFLLHPPSCSGLTDHSPTTIPFFT